MDLFKRRKGTRDYLIHRADVVSLIRRRLNEPLAHLPQLIPTFHKFLSRIQSLIL